MMHSTKNVLGRSAGAAGPRERMAEKLRESAAPADPGSRGGRGVAAREFPQVAVGGGPAAPARHRTGWGRYLRGNPPELRERPRDSGGDDRNIFDSSLPPRGRGGWRRAGVTLLAVARAASLAVRMGGERLVVRGPRLAQAVAERVLVHKRAVVEAIKSERPTWPADSSGWDDDARHRFLERLGVADDLGLPTDPGTPARDIALREARRASAGILPDIPRSREPDLIDRALEAFADLGGLTCMRVERPTPRKGLSS